MSRIAEVREHLLETTAAIAKLERAIADSAESPSLLLNMHSLQRRKADLEERFRFLAAEMELDVCTYRLLPEQDDPSVLSLSKALMDFQLLFSIVYDALKTGPKKQRARIGKDALAETSFGFGYVFSGSLGVVMTLPNERLLVGATQMDEAMGIIFEIAHASDRDAISEFARRLGPPTVRSAYAWAVDHIESKLNVSIEWRHDQEVRSSLLIQLPELERLRDAIAETSDEIVEEVTIEGELVGADIPARKFHMQTAVGEIRGWFIDAIGEEHRVTVPRRYEAVLQKTTRIHYSTEKEETTWLLLRLRPI
jgi:hypothetical protein